MTAEPSQRDVRRVEAPAPDRPQVEILNRQPHPVDRSRIRHAAHAAFLAGNGAGDVITILLAGDRKLRQLNRDFRGKDRTTDVLSFPDGERDASGVTRVGDIAVSVAEAARQALEEGIELDAVLERLVAHGVLHLLGFDHETDDGEMLELQAHVLSGLTR